MGGGGQASYTFSLRITYKKGGGGVQKACKNAYVINGRPLSLVYIGPRCTVPHTPILYIDVGNDVNTNFGCL